MATNTESIIDWEKVVKYSNIDGAVAALGYPRVIELIGIEEALRIIGPDRVIETLGLAELIRRAGPAQVWQLLRDSVGKEEIAELAFGEFSPEELRGIAERMERERGNKQE